MCDYSLMHLPNRLAVEGEDLVAHRFPSGSMGFASPADLCPIVQPTSRQSFWSAVKRFFNPEVCSIPAVCIPPATRVIMRDIGEYMQREYGLQAVEECAFEELTAALNTYRDAIRFRNGCHVRLQELPVGQRVTVLGTAMRDNPRQS